jgi:hypothetical protein
MCHFDTDATLAGCSFRIGRAPHHTSAAALLPAISDAVRGVNTSFRLMLIGIHDRQTASLVAEILSAQPAKEVEIAIEAYAIARLMV